MRDILVTFHLRRRDHDCIYPHAAQVPVDIPHNSPRITVVLYDEQVNVAMAVQVAPRGGSEENDSLRMSDLYYLRYYSQSRRTDRRGERVGRGHDVQGDVADIGKGSTPDLSLKGLWFYHIGGQTRFWTDHVLSFLHLPAINIVACFPPYHCRGYGSFFLLHRGLRRAK